MGKVTEAVMNALIATMNRICSSKCSCWQDSNPRTLHYRSHRQSWTSTNYISFMCEKRMGHSGRMVQRDYSGEES